MALPVALAAVERFLAKSGDTPEPAISFYGGEPLLAMPVIVGVVAHVRRRYPDRPVRFCLDTNGLRLDDPDVADLIRRERLSLQVSLDGPAPVHDRHRRTVSGDPTHARVEANLTALLRADPSLAGRLLLIATLAPPYDLPAVRDYFAAFPPFRRAGLDREPMLRVNQADLDGLDLGRDETGPPTAADWDRQVARLRDEYLDRRGAGGPVDPFLAALFDESLVRWHHRSGSPLGPTVGRGGCCLPGVRRQHVQADGTLQPCERVGSGLLLGRAETGPQPARIQDLRAAFTECCDGACSSCWAVRLCRICYQALLPGERERLPDRCRAVRAGSEAVIRLFLDLQARGSRSLQWLENTSIT
jgi:uncharacterized protein